MTGASGSLGDVFLCAGVPDPRRGGPEVDSVAVQSAVLAVLRATLGRRRLFWSGHAASTHTFAAMAEARGVDYRTWVRPYGLDPADVGVAAQGHVTVVDGVAGDREAGMDLVRRRMSADARFAAAVLIGSTDDMPEDLVWLRTEHPGVLVLPVASAGGMAARLLDGMDDVPPVLREALREDIDYVRLFHDRLDTHVP